MRKAKREREREGDTNVFGSEMDVERWVETLSNKVTNVAQTDEDEIADVGGKQNIIRGVASNMGEDLRAGDMGTGATVAFVGTVAEFCVDGGKDLLGSGGF